MLPNAHGAECHSANTFTHHHSYRIRYATTPYESGGRGTVDNATLFGDGEIQSPAISLISLPCFTLSELTLPFVALLGVLFAGSFLLHALGQRHRFELLDFSSHVFAVHVADAANQPEPALVAFVHRVRTHGHSWPS